MTITEAKIRLNPPENLERSKFGEESELNGVDFPPINLYDHAVFDTGPHPSSVWINTANGMKEGFQVEEEQETTCT
ncbi:unnamed protein product [Angiostrongylus costaricensis]|uniref:Uncharacterized protein n=1 Tax=Angiostrongylus costaricensis TaxID=334426 RepID=A0A0R3PSR5_ANGCS|nr:unnamed protein product [Angiostrongylus costaricensis]